MLRLTPLLLLGCLHADAAGQGLVSLTRPFDVGISSAFDTVRRRLVLFGDDGTTWELDGGDYRQRPDPVGAVTPPRRMRQAMCYDEARQRVLMFGGQATSPGAALGDTWSYDGSRWSPLIVGPAPSPRFDAAITWDFARQCVLLCGGQGGGGLGDTWEHHGATWVQRQPVTTPGPNSGRMCFDRQRGVAVLVVPSGLFGGPAATWEWDGTDWALRGGNGPITNANATLAFDRNRNRTVLVGGVPNDRIWEWDGSTWVASALPQPFQRLNAASFFDADSGCVAVVGGYEWQLVGTGSVQQGSMRADRWHWNGQTFTRVHDDIGPKAAFDAAVIPDPMRARIVHFGGTIAGGAVTDETWAFAGDVWSPVVSSARPSARRSAATSFDPALGAGLLFGGFANGAWFGDTWSIGATGWVARSATGPAPRASAGMASDPVRGVVVLFGGAVGPTYTPGALRNDTWEWNGAVWTQRATSTQPAARFDPAMAFHPLLGKVLLFGGRIDATAAGQLADTWAWDGTQWTALATATVPPALGIASMSTDLQTGRCTLVGLDGTQPNWRQQVWSHDGVDWLLALDEPAPLSNRWNRCVPGPSLDTLVCSGRGAIVGEWLRLPSRVATVGAGCGAPASTLLVRARPRIGTTTGLELVANPNRAVLFGLALTGGNTPLGGTCTLWLGPGWLGLFQPTDAAGFADQPLAVPADPALRGIDVFAQACVLEPFSATGFVLTQGLRLTLGD